MNLPLLRQFFSREAPMTADRTEADAVLDELEAEQQRRQRARAEQVARERKQTAEYQAGIAKRREAFLAELDAELRALWRVMPELRWRLTVLRELQARQDELGDGRAWEDVSGLPYGAVDQISTAITTALAGTRLGEEGYTPGEVSAPIIEPRRAEVLRLDPRRPWERDEEAPS
jgi:hypothetical protein